MPKITLRQIRQEEREEIIDKIKDLIKHKEYISRMFLMNELDKIK